MRVLVPLIAALSHVAVPAAEKPNVLLILVDDLKPAIGAYGDPTAITPSLDALTARGMRFDAAYCNQAVCAPSRFNLMLGSRSTSSGLYSLGSNLRKAYPEAVTLPQHFAHHGYHTESLGKVFHIGHGNHGDPQSFSSPHFKDLVIEYQLPESTGGGQLTREEGYFTNQGQRDADGKLRPRGAAFEAPDVGDEAYADGRVAAEAIKRLRAASERDEPFFIAVGFARPHLPFCVPKKYWDLYDPSRLPMVDTTTPPDGAPRCAIKVGGEITAYEPVPPRGTIDAKLARKLVHGYYASTSYVDAQIGKVITAVDELGLADDTLIVLWGDHGFHLGELGIWTKHVNFEMATRIPLIVVAPGITRPGSHTDQPAETVDIFPTLSALAGLPAPTGPQPIDGTSLLGTLKDPQVRVDDHAYHCFPRGGKLGRAIRTERYRLVAWTPLGQPNAAPVYELYDYKQGPVETKNIASQYPEIVASLRTILDQHPAPAKGR
ncbi:sulfatase [Haloferula rosea]|uniref:Sulfatase n=1 Tax=Haloferula rosea TaxID=490093 RepID=A0A934VEB8_9BACT|nr:sulfatase [Haloferula rosea]MBK1825886.1 sulfatase [Haloferula rosea]